jgi:hypothetical protein
MEMQRALERHDTGEAWVLPIHLRPVDWQEAPFARLQALPSDARPVTEWADSDQAFRNIAQGIRQVAQAIRHTSADVPIAHTILAEPEGIHKPRRCGVFLLISADAFLAAPRQGWCGNPVGWTALTRESSRPGSTLRPGTRVKRSAHLVHKPEPIEMSLLRLRPCS